MILDITKSFANSSIPGASKAQLLRIISAYKKSIVSQGQAATCYQVSREWLPIYSGYMQEVISALEAEDIDSLIPMYENFFREKLSTGLHGLHFEMVSKYMQPDMVPDPTDLNAYMNACQMSAQMFLLSNPKVPLDSLRRLTPWVVQVT